MNHEQVKAIVNGFKSTSIEAGLTLDSIIAACFEGNPLDWRYRARIVPNWLPKFSRPETRPIMVVQYGDQFLTHSKGAKQGFFWNFYGDDMLNAGLAFIALLQAPTPPHLWMATCFADQKGE